MKRLRVLFPTRIELIVYLAVSTTVLVAINFFNIADSFIDPEITRLGLSVVRDRAASFIQIISQLTLASTLVLTIFWAIVGIALYIAGFTIYEVYIETSNDLIESSTEMHHPHYFRPGLWLAQALTRAIVRVLAFISIVGLSFTVFGFILPFGVQLVRDAVYFSDRPLFILNPLLGILLVALTLHLYVILTRVLFLRPRLTGATEPEEN